MACLSTFCIIHWNRADIKVNSLPRFQILDRLHSTLHFCLHLTFNHVFKWEGGRDFFLPELLIRDHITLGEKTWTNEGTLQSTLGRGADERRRRWRGVRQGNGNLFSTLLGLKEWVWSTGERMNDGNKKKEPHKHLEDNCEEYFCMFSFKSK